MEQNCTDFDTQVSVNAQRPLVNSDMDIHGKQVLMLSLLFVLLIYM